MVSKIANFFDFIHSPLLAQEIEPTLLDEIKGHKFIRSYIKWIEKNETTTEETPITKEITNPKLKKINLKPLPQKPTNSELTRLDSDGEQMNNQDTLLQLIRRYIEWIRFKETNTEETTTTQETIVIRKKINLNINQKSENVEHNRNNTSHTNSKLVQLDSDGEQIDDEERDNHKHSKSLHTQIGYIELKGKIGCPVVYKSSNDKYYYLNDKGSKQYIKEKDLHRIKTEFPLTMIR